MLKLAITISCLCLSFLSFAQEQRCLSPAQVPLTLEESAKIRSDEITIPIVFHLVKTPDDDFVPDSRIDDLVDQLNTDFLEGPTANELVSGLGSTPGLVGFKFVLAEINPEGQMTSGILRTDTDVDNIGDLFDVNGASLIKRTSLGGSDAWDPENYVNVWIGQRMLSLGVTVAENSISSDVEGIVLSYRALLEYPKTISHEMGHYFGLLHPWGNQTGCDGEDDGISDTPFQAVPDFNCESVFNCSNFTLPGNIMDFNEDICLQYFTRLQARAIQQYASTFKSDLLSSTDCFFVNIPSSDIKVTVNTAFDAIEVYMGEDIDYELVQLFDIRGSLISSQTIKSQIFLNIPSIGIPTGVYLLHLKNKTTSVVTKIFIR